MKENVRKVYERLKREAEAGGYRMHPDEQFAMELVEGLMTNDERYGYMACPCRLAEGAKEEDLDIICPCDYRDQDIAEYGACYCALYVSDEVFRGEKQAMSIPERRPIDRPRRDSVTVASAPSSLPYPVYRCKVCGYLCARESPPEICPVCKAKKDRFERFM